MAMLNNQMVYVLYYILYIWLAQTLVFQTTNQICVALYMYIYIYVNQVDLLPDRVFVL